MELSPLWLLSSKGDSLAVSVNLDNPLDHLDWDARLLSEGQGSIFHSAAWARVLVETYSFRPFYLTTDVCGSRLVVPIMEVSSWLTGRRGVSLPFTDECQLRIPPKGIPQLLDEALSLGRKQKWKYLEFRGCPGLRETTAGAQPSTAFYSHALKVLSNSGQLFSSFESPVRRAIRRGEKSGIRIDISRDSEALRDFYRLHCITRKKHGVPPQPFRFFLNIGKYILSQNLGMIVSAKYKRDTIAAAVFFRFGSEAVYKFGASDPRFQDLRPNNLVIWKAIQHCAQNGISTLNFGRTNLLNEGLRRFKLGWGAEERTIEYHKFDFHEQSFVRSRDTLSGWQNKFFRVLPRFASKWSGALFYRHIA